MDFIRQDRGRILGARSHTPSYDLGPNPLWPICSLVLKARKYALLYVVNPQTSIICGADCGSTIALDLQ